MTWQQPAQDTLDEDSFHAAQRHGTRTIPQVDGAGDDWEDRPDTDRWGVEQEEERDAGGQTQLLCGTPSLNSPDPMRSCRPALPAQAQVKIEEKREGEGVRPGTGGVGAAVA